MKKGEIYKLKKELRDNNGAYANSYIHSFVFWEDEYADYRGIMLTTSGNEKYNNIQMKKEHFEEYDCKGEPYTVIYGKSSKNPNSYIAPLYLLKDVEYEYLDKVGQLTCSGIEFINNHIRKLEYTDWRSYKLNTIKLP